MKEYSLGTDRDEVNRLLPNRVIKKISLGTQELAGLRVDDNVYVFRAFCPHRGASLIQATINSSQELICPLHQYRFDLKTGQLRSGYCGDLEVFQTRLEETGLKIIVP
jgi:nitrite reductase/ring-hydroxylating ferredoxin subunit